MRSKASARWSDPRIDLSPFEEAFNMPKIPVWVEDLGEYELGSFHQPDCNCGRGYGIALNLPLLEREGRDPNSTLLHEAVHALQYHYDPEGMRDSQFEEHLNSLLYGEDYAYANAPHEQIARDGAEFLSERGMRVWRPERHA